MGATRGDKPDYNSDHADPLRSAHADRLSCAAREVKDNPVRKGAALPKVTSSSPRRG